MDPTHKRWLGKGWAVLAVPGGQIILNCGSREIEIDEQDVGELSIALLDTARDGRMRILDSCVMGGPAEWFSILVQVPDGAVSMLRIDPQYSSVEVDVPRGQAYELSGALLSAGEHWSNGPCPRCGISLADDHPCNGCPS